MTAELIRRWRESPWVLLPEVPLPPAEQAALDEVLLAEVGAGRRPPMLRFWAWAAPAVIIGRFQSVRNEVDEAAAGAMGFAVVRRMSGGGAMFVQPGSTITYSLYMPEDMVAGLSIRDSYPFCDRWAVEAFQDLGLNVWYAPLNDITSPEGKIGGAAQARKPGVVLHHTTIAYEMNPDEMLRVLRVGREKLSDKGIPSAAKRVGPLRHQTDLSRLEIVERLTDGFRRRFSLTVGSLKVAELAAARNLAVEKYASITWTHELP